MNAFFSLIQLFVLCGALLSITVIVCLSLKECQLRSFLLPIVGWCMAIFCGIYCISPIDLVPEAFLGPFGLIDDLGAVVAGISAIRMAMSSNNKSA